jgi:hypothetical protein
MNDLAQHIAALPPAARPTRRLRYAALRPQIQTLWEKGYNARQMADLIHGFPPWNQGSKPALYSAIAYHLRNHVKTPA